MFVSRLSLQNEFLKVIMVTITPHSKILCSLYSLPPHENSLKMFVPACNRTLFLRKRMNLVKSTGTLIPSDHSSQLAQGFPHFSIYLLEFLVKVVTGEPSSVLWVTCMYESIVTSAVNCLSFDLSPCTFKLFLRCLLSFRFVLKKWNKLQKKGLHFQFRVLTFDIGIPYLLFSKSESQH